MHWVKLAQGGIQWWDYALTYSWILLPLH